MVTAPAFLLSQLRAQLISVTIGRGRAECATAAVKRSARSCGTITWWCVPAVVHAVADQPSTAPYRFTRKEVVAPVFAHEPTVSRAPTGEWVMFYTTNFGVRASHSPAATGAPGTPFRARRL